ncbi:MAG: Fic family protein [Salinivirgaceae bacterium]|nr:Fic family protein [Salinivirgaceae bacterium]
MWKELELLRKKYLDLNLDQVIDYEKLSMISMVYHSTKIEGCSLSENDTIILLENGITANGKPLTDHLMVKDHYNAFLFIKEKAQAKCSLSIDFLKETAAIVMQHTGGKVNSMGDSFDTSKGDLRLAQVYVDKKYFPDFKKVESLLNQLLKNINDKLANVNENDVLKLAADFHYNFINIHPFGDGNGRTARLLMNYIQFYHNEPLLKIFTEDRAAYIEALNKTEELEDLTIFRDFICLQQSKFFKLELEKYKKRDKGFALLF